MLKRRLGALVRHIDMLFADPVEQLVALEQFAHLLFEAADVEGNLVLFRQVERLADDIGAGGVDIGDRFGVEHEPFERRIGLLDQAKLPVSDFQFQFLGPADALSAFTAGQVDAWAVWNPYATIGKNTAGAKIIADGREVTTGQSYFSAASEALADPKKSAALADFFERLARAQVWADAHPEAWVPIFAKLTKLPEDVAAASFDTSKGSYVPIDGQRIAKQQRLIDLFTAAGLVKQAPVAGDWFDARFNAQIQAGAK